MPTKAEPEPIDITVSGRNMPVSEPLRGYAVEKLGRLSRYLDRVARIEVVLSNEHTRATSGRNLAEATAMVKGRVLRAESSDADMYAAIDGLVDKLHLQLTKTKERTRDHKRRASTSEIVESQASVGLDLDIDEEDETADQDPIGDRIVEVKRFDMKPMFPDEAIEEMNELGHSFFVFLHARTESVSVVYRRRDGLYGLIEPER